MKIKINLVQKLKLNKFLFKLALQICVAGLLGFPVIVFPQSIASPQNETPRNLTPNLEIEREIRGSATHFYQVEANENDCLRLTIQQKGIDVVISAKNSAGEIVSNVDRPNGSVGRETMTFVAEKSGAYIIEITGYNPYLLPNKYSIRLAEMSPPNETDRRRIAAEKLTTEGESLRNKGGEPSNKQAVEKFQQAFSIWKKLDDSYEQAVVDYGLGWSYIQLNNYGEATLNFVRALKIVEILNDDFARTINHAGIGWAELYSGNLDTAAFNFEQASDLARENQYQSQIGKALFGLGNIAYLRGDYAEAFDLLTECIRVRRAINEKTAENLTNVTLAKVLLKQNKFAEAIDLLNRTLSFFGTINKKNGAGDAANTLGWAHLSLGDDKQALENFELGLKFGKEIGDQAAIAVSLRGLSLTHFRLSEFQKAQAEINEVFEILESLRSESLSGESRLSFTAFIQDYYEDGISVLMQMHEREADQHFACAAFELSEKSRSRSLLDSLREKRSHPAAKIDPNLLARKQIIYDELIENLVRESDLRRTEKDSPALKNQRVEIQNRLFSLREIESKISRENSASTLPTAAPTLSLAEIQKNLDSETVLLEYSLGARQSYLWLVTAKKFSAFPLPPREIIETLARELHEALITQKTDRSEGVRIFNRKAEQLGKILLGQVAPQLKNQRILIVPEGGLQYIPFAALPKNGQPLVADHEVIFLPSASLLAFLKDRNKTVYDKEIAVFADPIYTPDDARLGKFAAGKSNADKNGARLFSSRFEAEAISSFVPKNESLVRLDAAASRESVIKSDLNRYRILHFATHAFVDDERPELSAIMLSNYDENGRRTNGLLRSAEIFNLHINAEMVVLSGCRTAAGKNVRGEGLLGLTRDFLLAGTSRLIVSLWEVEDKATAELMARFYRKHLREKMPATAALRSAQIEMMNDQRWRAPFYWAAFTTQGDWR